ncbi:MAG: ATP synthase F0 subunit B [Dehalococcoidales bacterium]|nr:ATP synthase F0 subunit B [Dehalococcoidales bacterium]
MRLLSAQGVSAKMAKTESKPEIYRDEFARIFDEYRAKIEEISRRAATNQFIQSNPPSILDEDAAETVAVAVPRLLADLQVATGTARSLPEQEAERIIREAKRQAEQIIAQAEEKSRKEATKRTQAQVEKLLSKARRDAEEIVARAKQTTEAESQQIITQARQEAERLIREITEKVRQETRLHSAQVVAETRQKAERTVSELINGCREISQSVNTIVARMQKTVDELEARLQADVAELAKAIAETQSRLDRFTVTLQQETQEKEATPQMLAKTPRPAGPPKISLRILGARVNSERGGSFLVTGRVEMRSASASFDYQCLTGIRKYLVSMPSIRYIQELVSEKEISALFEITEPVPLLDIIRRIPLVEEAVDGGETISITLKKPA